jgi:hypothetical protein
MTFKEIAASPLVLVVGMALAWGVGRATAPTKVVTTETVKEIHHETVQTEKKMDISELQTLLTQFAQSVQKNVIIKRVEDTRPDGTKHVTEETADLSKTDTKTSTDTKTTTVASTTEDTKVWKETVRVEERIKLVEKLRAPDAWSLGVTAGINLPHLLTGGLPNYIPGLPSQVVVGALVERHLFWSIYTGVWGNSRGDGGVQLRVGF